MMRIVFVLVVLLAPGFCDPKPKGQFLWITDQIFDESLEMMMPNRQLACKDSNKTQNCQPKVAPWDAVIDTIKEILPEPDFIIFTGGAPAKKPFLDNYYWQEGVGEFMTTSVREKFPFSKLFPVLGLPTPDLSDDIKLYHSTDITTDYEILSDQITTLNDTVAKGIYKSKLKDDVLVVGVNTLVFTETFQLRAPGSNQNIAEVQLKWLENELLIAQEQQKDVILIGTENPSFHKNKHEAISSEFINGTMQMTAKYNDKFMKLMTNYSHVLKWSFFGHHDSNLFRVVENSKGQPTSFAVLGPKNESASIIPFRVVDYSVDTMDIQDVAEYAIDIKNINSSEGQKLKKKFDLSENFNLSPMTVHSLTDFVANLAYDDDLLETFYDYFFDDGVPFEFKRQQTALGRKKCKKNCKKKVLCCLQGSYCDTFWLETFWMLFILFLALFCCSLWLVCRFKKDKKREYQKI